MRQVVGTGLLALLVLVAYGNEVSASGLTELSALTLAVGKGGEGTTSFVVSGDAPRLIVIRGLGPSVTDSGKGKGKGPQPMIRDPKLVLFSGGTPIASNDNWQDDANASQIPPELQPGDDKEAALARSLAPGKYVVVLQESSKHGKKDEVGIVSVTQVEVAQASACSSATTPCQTIATTNNGAAVKCLLSSSTCGVDLNLLVQGLSSLYGVTAATPMWIGAWGGGGGHSSKAGSGSAGGYAQTTTSVADYTTQFGSSMLFYFIGQDGASVSYTCGGAGGSATIVTSQDLSLTPSQNPSGNYVLLVAGASGGGGGYDTGGFCQVNPNGSGDGGSGGVAIAGLNVNAEGPGANSDAFDCGSPQGGYDGIGGAGCETATGDTHPGNGQGGGFGGLGAPGGNGADCTVTNTAPTQFLNVSLAFSFSAGSGGTGGGGTSSCDSGGGGGGGGFGGGGGGGHGNGDVTSVGGGGGASFALAATRVSAIAPTSEPTEDCPNNSSVGCVQINFDLTQSSSSP
jgi:hypothetical protein